VHYVIEYRLGGERRQTAPFTDRDLARDWQKAARKMPGVSDTRLRCLDRELVVDLAARTVWLRHDGSGYEVRVLDSGAIELVKEDGEVREVRPGSCTCEAHRFGAHKGVVCRHRNDLGAVRALLAPLMAALMGKARETVA
jgi:hypothetical protein